MTYRTCGLRAGAAFFALGVSLLASESASAQSTPSASTPAADATAAAATDANGGEGDIVVTGSRAALREATAEKRAALNFEETLHANDVGKLPDQNVAEAVKRLPGLSVANDQGEGRYVIIRGIDPSLVNVTLNGQTLPAPEPDGRVVKLDDLPSAMIQSIVVTKSLLPSQDANAIGGEVNIRTKTAFDGKKPFFFDARGSVGWYSLNHKVPFELDGTLGGRFGAKEQFGAVVSVNYSKRPIESENFQGSDEWEDGVPAGGGLRDYNLTRTRLGIVGNFDWHPTDTAKLYIRSSYSKFQDHETRDQNLLSIASAVAADGSTTAGTAIQVRHREEDDNTKSVTLGGDFDSGAAGTLEASGGWTRAEKKDPIRSEFVFKGPTVSAIYDPSTYPFTLAASGAKAAIFDTPSAFKFNKVNFETRSAYEELWQGRIDYTLPIDGLGNGSSFKAGFKYLDRHKADNRDRTDYKAGKTAWTADTVSYTADPHFYGDLYHFGARVDWYKARDFVDDNPSVLKLDPDGTLSDTLASDYDVKEEIVAGYAMLTIKAGALTVIPGVRVEHTRDRTAAKIVDANSTLDEDFNVFGRKSYTDWFPSVNAKYEVTPDLLLRGAVTTSIGRPNYANLAPFTLIEDDAPNTNFTLGNPDLKPYKAVNFDASIEYYPNKDSLFSAGFFHKEIDNPIYIFERKQDSYTIGNTTYANAVIDQPINADKEVISGVEFNAQTQFTSLPGLLSGFGISANYSHIWGHATAPQIRPGKIPLGYQSHDVGNVAIFYEKYNLTARLAFNYRSAFPDVVADSADGDNWYDSLGQLDLHIGYQITPAFTIFGDAINLTDGPWRHYIGSKNNLLEREQYGAQLRGGVQIHF